jgi:porphyrinogen peroxidase
MSTPQPGILAPAPGFSRYLEFSASSDSDPVAALKALAARAINEDIVIGLGPGLVQKLGHPIEGLRPLPAISGPGCEIPSTQTDIWFWVRGDDRGWITHKARAFSQMLKPAFNLVRNVDGFTFDQGLDLSGYVDGTENPEGEDAFEAGIVQGAGKGLDGSSFVATQQWVHDLDHFDTLSEAERDDTIGRRIRDNEEFDEAPASAHVKRTAQESFDPEAYIVRRSMPWADASGEGLMFVAFGKTLDAFEVQLRRMAGLEDGIIDGIFRFTRPISGSYFWCPPVSNGCLDFTAIGL